MNEDLIVIALDIVNEIGTGRKVACIKEMRESVEILD